MTARDKPDWERKRQQIIDGALTVFAAKGFEKATNQEIARAAGIGSPGLIYHYFENKADLLQQAVISRSTSLRSVVNDDALMDMAPHEALRLIASAFLTTLEDPDESECLPRHCRRSRSPSGDGCILAYSRLHARVWRAGALFLGADADRQAAQDGFCRRCRLFHGTVLSFPDVTRDSPPACDEGNGPGSDVGDGGRCVFAGYGGSVNTTRLFALIRKEFIQIIRDPRSLTLIFFMPMVQLFLLGFAATNDVRNVPLVVLDRDRSAASRQLLAAYRAAGLFPYRFRRDHGN